MIRLRSRPQMPKRTGTWSRKGGLDCFPKVVAHEKHQFVFARTHFLRAAGGVGATVGIGADGLEQTRAADRSRTTIESAFPAPEDRAVSSTCVLSFAGIVYSLIKSRSRRLAIL